MNNATLVFYRYDDAYWADSSELQLTRYFLVKETKCGWWVRHEYSDVDDPNCEKKFVLNGKGKRLCYPTQEEALDGYLQRKRRQIEILGGRLNKAKRMQAIAAHMAGKVLAPKPENVNYQSVLRLR